MEVGVVGLGYVGLPLAIEFSKKYRVIGFDINENKIEELKKGNDIARIVDEDLRKYNIECTSDEEKLKTADYIIIAVPTPVNELKKPELSHLEEATKIVAKKIKKGAIVIYESTVYPGVTEDICIPIIEKYSGKKCGKDFSVGYSPERINPGDKEHNVTNIKKIVSATDKTTLKKIANLYNSIIKVGVYEVESIKTAEAAKILENTQRDINIAFMNEMSNLFKKLNINTKEVLEAAKTKWNFINFSPGMVGGHCIGVDPYYLIELAEKNGEDLSLIKTARNINESIPQKIVNDIEKRLKQKGKELSESKIVVMGITFKENVTDTRNSKSLELIYLLEQKGAEVIISDQFADNNKYNLKKIEEIENVDMVVFSVAHNKYKELKPNQIKKMSNIIYDVKNIFDDEILKAEGIEKISL